MPAGQGSEQVRQTDTETERKGAIQGSIPQVASVVHEPLKKKNLYLKQKLWFDLKFLT